MCWLAVICNIFQVLTVMSSGKECYGKYGFECCNGFKWNSQSGECEKCPRGFTGRGCIFHCVYPSYGDKCQYECRCEPALCDPANGCLVLETTEQKIIFVYKKTTRNVTQYITIDNLDGYQSVTSFKMNTSIHFPLVSGSYRVFLIASISSIVFITIVVCAIIFLRNVRLQNQVVIQVININPSDTSPELSNSRKVEESVHLSLYESQDFHSANEEDSSFYEELKGNPYEVESDVKHTYLLVLDNDEMNNAASDDNDLEVDVYISPVNIEDRQQDTAWADISHL